MINKEINSDSILIVGLAKYKGKSAKITISIDEEIKNNNIMRLKGLGKEIWDKINLDHYIEQERDSWDKTCRNRAKYSQIIRKIKGKI